MIYGDVEMHIVRRDVHDMIATIATRRSSCYTTRRINVTTRRITTRRVVLQLDESPYGFVQYMTP